VRWTCNWWIHSTREDFIALRAIVIAPWSAAWTCVTFEQIPPLATLWSKLSAGSLQKCRIFWGLGLRFGSRFSPVCRGLSEWKARRGCRSRDRSFIALSDYLVPCHKLHKTRRLSGTYIQKLERPVII
jgi:hypothetical protein